MPFAPITVSNSVLRVAQRDGVAISPMKLQKILYFLASEYYKDTHTVLISEPFQAWKFGPVLNSVYQQFKRFGAKSITEYGRDEDGDIFAVHSESNPTFAQCLERVWGVTRDLTAAQLSKITHFEGSAWFQTFTTGAQYIDDARVGADCTYQDALDLAR